MRGQKHQRIEFPFKAARVALAVICYAATFGHSRFIGFNILVSPAFLDPIFRILNPIFWIATVLVARLLFAGNNPPIKLRRRRSQSREGIQSSGSSMSFRSVRIDLAVICCSIGIWASFPDGFSMAQGPFSNPVVWIAVVMMTHLLFGGDDPLITFGQSRSGS